ncbi:MAG: HAMP domain-containing protein [Candidatus Hydrogenedentes bacterium]|nr:HAMP domain-containing protein [Candidatus Hydrogenedentota bacterium]
MLSIRHKLILASATLLLCVAFLGAAIMAQITSLSRAIDVILRENYRSVVACQQLKEALERIDSGLLYGLAGREEEGQKLLDEYRPAFEAALQIELNNITLPGEHEKAAQIQGLFSKYTASLADVMNPDASMEARQAAYFTSVQPRFQRIKDLAQEVLEMNQANMTGANDAARRMGDSARQRIGIAIIASAVAALFFSYGAHRWILTPINKLILSANEIRRGNLDLVINAPANDEVGQLAAAFNEMTSVLRQNRKHDQFNLIRTRRATEEVFKALPAAVAVIDLNGIVEVATESAGRHFGLTPGVAIRDLGLPWLPSLVNRALDLNRLVEVPDTEGFIQRFAEGQEHFFQPVAVPIPVNRRHAEATGTALLLHDVTQLHEQRELKRSVVSTVSHQLKTPLHALRMSVHLLLEERIGTLNEQQVELLIAAREESDRLATILEDLLDLNRIASGHSNLALQPVSPKVLTREGIDPFLTEAREKGVSLVNNVPDDLPDVLADAPRIHHVFENLIANALRFTLPGGAVTLSATADDDWAAFTVSDTGPGIEPEYLPHIFEQFFRVPGQDARSGVGLGLAIVKEIVEAHGGAVTASSTPGAGASFTFTLPIREFPHHNATQSRGEV